MDGHRSGVECITSENSATALGRFEGESYIAPSGAKYASDSPVAVLARKIMDAQPALAHYKEVVGHSDAMLMNLRNQPDLPLGNLIADMLRSYASDYFGVPMDLAITNYGGIRTPLPEGAVTLEDISSMFPFKNYLCYVKIRGRELQRLLDQLAGTKAFQAVSGGRFEVEGGKIVSAQIGGAPINPSKVYNLATIDFLLDGGDKLNIGALAQDVKLTKVLMQEVILTSVKQAEARGEVLSGKSDGRVIMR